MHLDGSGSSPLTVRWLGIKPPWILCPDRTNWKIGRGEINILTLAITTRRVRIPPMWTLLPCGGCRNPDQRIDLMRRSLALFDPASISWLLADREFIGIRWVNFLFENNIIFAIGLNEDAVIHVENGHTYQFKSLLQNRYLIAVVLSEFSHL